MTRSNPIKNVLILLIWVPVGDCPGLTFSLLAKVFAKGKMFWYQKNYAHKLCPKNLISKRNYTPKKAIYPEKNRDSDF